MRFTDIFIKRPVLAVSISFLIALLGLQAIFKMQVRDIDVPVRPAGIAHQHHEGIMYQPLLLIGSDHLFIEHPLTHSISFNY